MTALEQSLRVTRIIYFGLMAAAVLYATIGEVVHQPQPKDVRQLEQILGVLAATSLVPVAFLRRQMVQPSEEILRTRPDDSEALKRWQAGTIASLALCEAVAAYGLILRLLGGTFQQAALFYGAALVTLLLLRPRKP